MKVISNNRKAFYDYFVSDLVEAGIVLEGCEVKSVRSGGVSLLDSFVIIKNGEMFLKNAYIKTYDKTTSFKPDERRTRKLLLNKSEIQKFQRMVKEKGFSIIATKIYIKSGRVKVEIGLAKGKKLYDKRATLKEKSIQRDIERFSWKFAISVHQIWKRKDGQMQIFKQEKFVWACGDDFGFDGNISSTSKACGGCPTP